MKQLFIFFILFSSIANAQGYNVANIPDSLKENADAVIRVDENYLEIVDIDKAFYRCKKVITVLNEYGDRYAVFNEQYDKHRSLRDIDGYLFDANGTKIKSVKRKDIYDINDDGDALQTDDRKKVFKFSSSTYPYTVEYSYEIKFNGLFYLPSWFPIDNFKVAVQKSSFEVDFPLAYSIKYKEFNIKNKLEKAMAKTNVYKWQLNNSKAEKYEPFQSFNLENQVGVMIAPSKFKFDDYEGNMNSWLDFGKFQSQLNKDRDNVPTELKETINKLIVNAKNTEEKVKLIYEFLQQNTRYISIQLGIGGWQPFSAAEVNNKKYGDCKALSNYMVSLLKSVGIKAHHVLIRSSDQDTKGLLEDLPCVMFNHMICCVPLEKDTIWLECTSQKVSAGYMGSSTAGKKVLLITDDGGVVATTPKLNAKENKEIRHTNATVAEDGSLDIKVNTLSSGYYQEHEFALFHYFNDEQKLEDLNHHFHIPSYAVSKVNYKEIKGRVPIMIEDMELKAQNYANITGKRLFIKPNIFNKKEKLEDNENRKNNILFHYGFTVIDTIKINIPAGYTIEAQPKNVSLSNKFGKYKIDYSLNNNVISCTRYFEQHEGEFLAKDYAALVEYYNEMSKADNAKMVLVKL